MGRLVITEYVSLDGVVQAPSGATLANSQWNNTTVLSGNLVEEVAGLKRRYERDILGALHQLVYPVIVGAGVQLLRYERAA